MKDRQGDRLGVQLSASLPDSVRSWRRGGTGLAPAAGEASPASTASALCRWGDPVLLRFTAQKLFVSSEHCSALALPPQGGGRPWV